MTRTPFRGRAPVCAANRVHGWGTGWGIWPRRRTSSRHGRWQPSPSRGGIPTAAGSISRSAPPVRSPGCSWPSGTASAGNSVWDRSGTCPWPRLARKRPRCAGGFWKAKTPGRPVTVMPGPLCHPSGPCRRLVRLHGRRLPQREAQGPDPDDPRGCLPRLDSEQGGGRHHHRGRARHPATHLAGDVGDGFPASRAHREVLDAAKVQGAPAGREPGAVARAPRPPSAQAEQAPARPPRRHAPQGSAGLPGPPADP